MATFQLLFPPPLLLLLLVSWAAASASPARQLPPCRVVQMDVICSDLSLGAAPADLPPGVQRLDLSGNQVQNLTRETLAYRSDLRRLDLRSNKIHAIQPGLFEDMADLKVLDLSRNRLNVFAHSKIAVGPLTAVESLDLSGNGLYTGMSDYLLADCPSLANLSLNGNSITRIAQSTFTGSLALRRISLHNNVILEIEDGAFDCLRHLTELDLSKNSIACITDFNLHNLKVLNLSKNSVERFQSASSTHSYRLSHLDLSENKMLYFPSLPRDNALQYLDVSRNHLQSVNVSGSGDNSSGVFLNRLKYLDMSYNRLQSAPESFFSPMTSLEVLNVSNNCIAEFSLAADGLLPTLRIINLSFNSLRSLTFGENSLRSLEKLFLQGNDLTVLDHQVFQRLPNINYLQLQHNRLEICDPRRNRYEPAATGRHRAAPPGCVSFTSVRNLRSLCLAENELQFLPANAFADTPLKLLDLSLNPALDLDHDSLSGLEHSLVHLLLRENNMSSLNADLSLLTSLKHVDLSTNQLTSLPSWNKEASIESLNLQNNNLVTLERSTMLALEHSLKTLYMGSNPLSCCSNLGFLHTLQRSAVVVADIETVTCVHEDFAQPVNIEKLTEGMCRVSGNSAYVVVGVLALLAAMIALGLLVRRHHARKRKRDRSFIA